MLMFSSQWVAAFCHCWDSLKFHLLKNDSCSLGQDAKYQLLEYSISYLLYNSPKSLHFMRFIFQCLYTPTSIHTKYTLLFYIYTSWKSRLMLCDYSTIFSSLGIVFKLIFSKWISWKICTPRTGLNLILLPSSRLFLWSAGELESMS